jgi:hypothetical protein
MSDPVSNADIEDVLSSIRRLVTDDGRAAEVPSTAPVASGRLVLTPALRVMDSDTPEEMPSAVVHSETVDDEDKQAATDEVAPTEATDLPAPEWVEGHEIIGVDLDDSAKRNLEAKIAELEAVIANSAGQWEQDGEEGSANAGGPVKSMNWEGVIDTTEPEEAQMVELVEEDQGDHMQRAVMPFLRPTFTVPDENKNETTDETTAGGVEDLAADMKQSDPEAPELSAPRDAPQRKELDAPVAESDPIHAFENVTEDPVGADPHTSPQSQSMADDYEGQDFVVDEEALRVLVTQIVHQELQGALGERITRNVRNLVRREIHRALTSQGLE